MSLFHGNTYILFWFVFFFYILKYHQACAIVNISWENSLYVPWTSLLRSAGVPHLYEGSPISQGLVLAGQITALSLAQK